MTISPSAAEAFPIYAVPNVPASGPGSPDKRTVLKWAGQIEALLEGISAGSGVIFTTLSQAAANLSYPANTLAWIALDATPANNGIYQKLGTSGTGSWSRVANLPYSFYRAQNEDAGSANAIVATNGSPSASTQSLIVVNVTQTNTSSVVTLTLNGDTPLSIKTSSGNNPAAGALQTGMLLAGYIEGTNFRLISDLASAAIQAAAEAAQAAAENARDLAIDASDLAATVGAGDVPTCPSLALAQSTSFIAARSYVLVAGYTNKGDAPLATYLRVATQPTHAGKFRSTDRFLPNGTTNSTNGGWWELQEKFPTPLHFGAKLDGTTDDTTAMSGLAGFVTAKGLGTWLATPGVCALASDVTLTGRMRHTPGFILKPAASKTVILSKLPDAGLDQIFDLSASGSVMSIGVQI